MSYLLMFVDKSVSGNFDAWRLVMVSVGRHSVHSALLLKPSYSFAEQKSLVNNYAFDKK